MSAVLSWFIIDTNCWYRWVSSARPVLGGRKAKRITLGLVVVDQRVFEEFRKRSIDVVTRERAPAKLTEGDVDPVLGRRLVGVGGESTTDVETVAFERREMGPNVSRRSFADLLCLSTGLWLDLSSRDDRGGDGNEPRALGLGVLGDPETGFDELVALRLEGGRGATNAVAGLEGSVREAEGHRVAFREGLVAGGAVGGRPHGDFEACE